VETFDVIVAGAGPGGVATAVALRQRGVARVCLLDRARFPRDKPCGGGLTGHAALAMHELGLELVVPHTRATRARVLGGEISREVALAKPVCVIDRREFDASLVEQARARGIEVRTGDALRDFAVDDEGVRVDSAGGTLRAQALVGADGAGSLVRKRLAGGRPAAPPIRLFRGYLSAGDFPEDLMLYDFSAMARGLRGYVWVFPAPGGRVNVGLMHAEATARGSASASKNGAALVTLLREELATHGLVLGSEVRGWPAWGYRRSTRISASRVLCVGDAAGIDALSGEGISVAMEQGLVAAEAITDGLAAGSLGFRDYRRRIARAVVGRELVLDGWLAWLLYRDGYRRWLDLLLGDPRILDLYAARVCGSLVLADHQGQLYRALGRRLAGWVSGGTSPR
jgi:geranylgeranyl reductase family protein